MNRKYILIFLILFGIVTVSGQNQTNKSIQLVFDHLVTAYGSAKSVPQLVVLTTKQKTPAYYEASPKPIIKVDVNFYNLCKSFGKDSLNAMSVVISHELAHYYNDHTFCSDFAFAVSKTDKVYSGKLKLVSKTERMSLETQADYKGLFHAAIAGYAPFEIYASLLDEIYKSYSLQAINPGYPSKAERKEIAHNAQMKAAHLYTVFQQGITSKENKKYADAIAAFEEINTYFPSRENYNNIGVIKTLQALDLKVLTSEEYHYPKRFLYPLEIDNSSRLKSNSTRGTDNNLQEQMTILLKGAQKDFEKSISLDVHYTKAYINLACVFDLLGNPEAALGKIKELPTEQQKEIDSQRIKAIAYFHAENEKKAEEIWTELKM
jgi:tetratricopeptide (TPR) repeat protein